MTVAIINIWNIAGIEHRMWEHLSSADWEITKYRVCNKCRLNTADWFIHRATVLWVILLIDLYTGRQYCESYCWLIYTQGDSTVSHTTDWFIHRATVLWVILMIDLYTGRHKQSRKNFLMLWQCNLWNVNVINLYIYILNFERHCKLLKKLTWLVRWNEVST